MSKQYDALKIKKQAILKRLMLSFLTYSPVFVAMGIIAAAAGRMSPYRLAAASFVAGFAGVIMILRRRVQCRLYQFGVEALS